MTDLKPDLSAIKAEARKAAFARRKEAHSPAAAQAGGVAHLIEALMPFKGKVISGYMPIRTEITPLPAMAALSAWSTIVIPVIEGGAGLPLRFAKWTPDCEMVEGAFGGAFVPAVKEYVDPPEVLVVPLVAFDAKGNRLGYGGGFYDRTLEGLRAKRATPPAFGYAYDAQRAEALPIEPTDQPLDGIITERGG